MSKLGSHHSQATTDALADDALRAAKLGRDLRVSALFHVVGHDCFALLGSQGVEELNRRSACRRLEDLDRFVVQVDRLHGERVPRLILDATAA